MLKCCLLTRKQTAISGQSMYKLYLENNCADPQFDREKKRNLYGPTYMFVENKPICITYINGFISFNILTHDKINIH